MWLGQCWQTRLYKVLTADGRPAVRVLADFLSPRVPNLSTQVTSRPSKKIATILAAWVNINLLAYCDLNMPENIKLSVMGSKTTVLFKD